MPALTAKTIKGVRPAGRTLIPRRVIRGGFTLIELLIVVAIIAILAAIAVPNFLEAQTRSKVSRTQTDLRSLATAIEAYRVDYNSYYRAGFYEDLAQRIKPLTTPVAYITSVPPDPFYKFKANRFSNLYPYYCYASGNIWGSTDNANPEYARSIYTLAGRGPDGEFNFGGICTMHPEGVATRALERGSYDPTNGTLSEGDIIRPGGSRI